MSSKESMEMALGSDFGQTPRQPEFEEIICGKKPHTEQDEIVKHLGKADGHWVAIDEYGSIIAWDKSSEEQMLLHFKAHNPPEVKYNIKFLKKGEVTNSKSGLTVHGENDDFTHNFWDS